MQKYQIALIVLSIIVIIIILLIILIPILRRGSFFGEAQIMGTFVNNLNLPVQIKVYQTESSPGANIYVTYTLEAHSNKQYIANAWYLGMQGPVYYVFPPNVINPDRDEQMKWGLYVSTGESCAEIGLPNNRGDNCLFFLGAGQPPDYQPVPSITSQNEAYIITIHNPNDQNMVITIDPAPCGVDKTICPTDSQICKQGQCVCQDSNLTNCDGECVNTQNNVSNCGNCGNICQYSIYSICDSGTCNCAPNMTQCGTLCTDTKTDKNNCGSCGNQCDQFQTCNNSKCV